MLDSSALSAGAKTIPNPRNAITYGITHHQTKTSPISKSPAAAKPRPMPINPWPASALK
jgi:hypothetical protein